jgi:hypothetical protein
MALLLTSSGFQRGIEADETGINIENFNVRYFYEVLDYLMGRTGEARARAHSAKFARDITVSGEVSSLGALSGLMLLGATSTVTLSNDVATFGDGTGTIYLDEATEGQTRGGWRSVDFRMSSRPGVTGTPA